MKNLIKSILLLICYFFLFSTKLTYATGMATVVEVLDADIILVQYEDGVTKTVQIKDVSSDKSPEAYKHAIQKLLNQQIYIIEHTKPQDLSLPQGWIYGEVRYGINKDIYDYNGKRYSKSISKTQREQLEDRERSYWNKRAININTATVDELASISTINTTQAKKIKEYRVEDDYTYRTLEELAYIPDIGISVSKLTKLEPYMHLYTDINKAQENELISLFGRTLISQKRKEELARNIIENRPFNTIRDARRYIGDSYDVIKDFIYTGNFIQSPAININTAHYTDIQSFLGISEDIAKGIYKHRGKYNHGKNINTKAYKDILNRISLYTNINTASKEELMLLCSDMNGSIANLIIEYRQHQRFSTPGEVREFFYGHNLIYIYNQVKEYITLI